MNIGVDYDGAFSVNTTAFTTFITTMKLAGHVFYLVTMRTPTEAASISALLTAQFQSVVATSRAAKDTYCRAHGIKIDIWIESDPHSIYEGANRVIRDLGTEGRRTQKPKVDN